MINSYIKIHTHHKNTGKYVINVLVHEGTYQPLNKTFEYMPQILTLKLILSTTNFFICF